MNKIAAVTGANRGIGQEIVRQLGEAGFSVIACGRDLKKVKDAVAGMKGEIRPFQLDVCSKEEAEALAEYLEKEYGRLDVLINNAGIIGNQPMIKFDMEEIRTVMETNFFGLMQLTGKLLPLIRKSPGGRIINLSSGMGALDDHVTGHASYRLSKWGLNGFTILLANELTDTQVRVNAMCPGWVRTDMGGASASRSVSKGAETAVWLATAKEIPTGSFFRDKKVIEWR
jgi:NAD(P)-dependent dehydrogenase (short-subunit alcohol dehydrogenase family)